MQLKGMTFPQALAYIGEERPRPTWQEKAKRVAERKELEAARWQESDLAWTLGKMIRLCHKALEKITPDTLDDFALILTELPTIAYQHDLLIHGDKTERAKLVQDLGPLCRFNRRTLLFRRDFDFAAWVRNLSRYQEPRNETGTKPGARCRVPN
jgi:hypothetical protein